MVCCDVRLRLVLVLVIRLWRLCCRHCRRTWLSVLIGRRVRCGRGRVRLVW